MKKILLLEDDKKTAKALGIRLRSAGYDVRIEHDGSQGIKAALTYQPDLILTDIWMPGEAGFEVAERLRAQGLEDVPFIFMTASRKKNLWGRSQEAGAAAFLEKPYPAEKLLSAIDHALAPQDPRRGKANAPSLPARNEWGESRREGAADPCAPPQPSQAPLDPAHS